MDNDTLLVTVKEAMRILRVGRNTLWNWDRAGYGPEPIHVGRPGARRRSLRYRRADLLDWIGVNHE
jgi:predicted DNA-binding transcriptional regulator AlpA